jgi:hypothetical protein
MVGDGALLKVLKYKDLKLTMLSPDLVSIWLAVNFFSDEGLSLQLAYII